MQKRGLSDVIVVVLLILIVLVAILIVWQFVRLSIIDSGEEVSVQDFTGSTFEITRSSIMVEGNNITFNIKRNTGSGDIVALIFNLRDIYGNSGSLRYNTTINELEVKRISFDYKVLGLSNLTSITVFPIFQVSSTRERASPFPTEYNVTFAYGVVGSGGSPTPSCTSNCETEGVGAKACIDASSYHVCGQQDLCLVWGSAQACGTGNHCVSGNCLPVGCTTDSDNDGYYAEPTCPQFDCNDANPNVHPGVSEICSDNIDNNCDSLNDCEDGASCSAHSSCALPSPLLAYYPFDAIVKAGNNWCNEADLNGGSGVNIADWGIYSNWIRVNTCSPFNAWCGFTDMDRDGYVNNTSGSADYDGMASQYGQKSCSGDIIQDASGKGYDSITHNISLIIPGSKGNGVFLDGNDDFLAFNQSNFYNETEISYSFWINTSLQNGPLLTNMVGNNFNSGVYWGLYITDGHLYYIQPYSPFVNISLNGTIYLNDSKWHNVVFTYRGNTLITGNNSTLYVDGILDSTGPLGYVPISPSNNPVRFGGIRYYLNPNAPYTFPALYTGGLDELMIFNKTLSDAEILQLSTKHYS